MTERAILETGRLTLRRFMPGDEDWFATLFGDPEVTRYLGGTRTRAQAGEMFATRVLAYYDTHPASASLQPSGVRGSGTTRVVRARCGVLARPAA